VLKLQGYPLDLSTSPAAGQVLAFNGTKWVAGAPASLPTVSGAAPASSGCTSSNQWGKVVVRTDRNPGAVLYVCTSYGWIALAPPPTLKVTTSLSPVSGYWYAHADGTGLMPGTAVTFAFTNDGTFSLGSVQSDGTISQDSISQFCPSAGYGTNSVTVTATSFQGTPVTITATSPSC